MKKGKDKGRREKDQSTPFQGNEHSESDGCRPTECDRSAHKKVTLQEGYDIVE